ncbi:MAG: DUF1186 domain-containing protein [Burkholderiaceae bacterium]
MSENWNTLRAQLEYFSSPFPHSAIAFANAHREEVAPFLIESLTRMAADPSIAENEEYVLHLYAMHLLATWRDARACVPLAALGHHPEDVLDIVLGDVITESYGRCLASVCDGDIAPLQALFEDVDASHWARNAALEAWAVRVIEGDSVRDDLLQYLMLRGDIEADRLRRPDTIRAELEILDYIVSVAIDIAAVEMIDRIDDWYADALLDPTISEKEWVHEQMRMSFDLVREQTLEHGRGYVRDPEKEMNWWSGFNESPVKARIPSAAPQPVRHDPKIGRNDPCPCGSGKKYKKCHGAS